MTGSDPYAALVGFAEREHAMVAGERYDELAALAAERRALIATLPATPPASARPHLERAASLQMATTAALQAALAVTRREMKAVDTRGQAVRAYARVA